MFYQCPVCGYSAMRFPAKENNICPCCGTEFGYDDFNKSHRKIRNEWLSKGAVWFSSETVPSAWWDGFRQVIENDLPFDVPIPRNQTNKFTSVRIVHIGQWDIQQNIQLQVS